MLYHQTIGRAFRPLVWNETTRAQRWAATDRNGAIYAILRLPSGRFEASFENFLHIGEFATLEDAQARCNRHSQRPKGHA